MSVSCPQSQMETAVKNCCLFCCYLYCAGVRNEGFTEWFRFLAEAIDKGLLGEDAYVKDGSKLIKHFTNKRYTITKKMITSIADIKDATPVCYYAKGYTPHWVVVENGKIVFNPLLNSQSVNRGKPIDSRPLSLEE